MFVTRAAVLMLTLIALAACQHKRQHYEPVPIPQAISQGSSLVLLKPFTVPSGTNAVYFQDGQLIDEDAIRADAPYCRLELSGPARTEFTIQPQNFLVKNVTYDDLGRGSAGEQVSITHLTLEAAKESGTERMICLWAGISTQADFVTPEEIAGALSGYFSIREPD